MGGFKGYIIDIISEIRLLYMYINVDNHLNNYVHMCILIQNINVYNKQKSGCTCKKTLQLQDQSSMELLSSRNTAFLDIPFCKPT